MEYTGDTDVSLERSRLRLDPTGQVGDLVEQTAALGHQLPDLAVGVHHRRVITTTESLSNLRK